MQELNRILFSAIESSLVGTPGEKLISKLYHGATVQQVLCVLRGEGGREGQRGRGGWEGGGLSRGRERLELERAGGRCREGGRG